MALTSPDRTASGRRPGQKSERRRDKFDNISGS